MLTPSSTRSQRSCWLALWRLVVSLTNQKLPLSVSQRTLSTNLFPYTRSSEAMDMPKHGRCTMRCKERSASLSLVTDTWCIVVISRESAVKAPIPLEAQCGLDCRVARGVPKGQPRYPLH